MRREKKEKLTFEDASIVAFLALRNFRIIPQKDPIGRVVFLVEGENVDEALRELYSNAPVGVLDYIKTFKGLRSSIFALKGGQR